MKRPRGVRGKTRRRTSKSQQSRVKPRRIPSGYSQQNLSLLEFPLSLRIRKIDLVAVRVVELEHHSAFLDQPKGGGQEDSPLNGDAIGVVGTNA